MGFFIMIAVLISAYFLSDPWVVLCTPVVIGICILFFADAIAEYVVANHGTCGGVLIAFGCVRALGYWTRVDQAP